MEKSFDSGIYYIVNTCNGDYYIGSSMQFYIRMRQHFSDLKSGRHSNIHLQNAVNKYGLDNFEFKCVEEVKPENLLEREQEYLDDGKWSTLYNMNRKSNH